MLLVPSRLGSTSFQSKDVRGAQYSLCLFCTHIQIHKSHQQAVSGCALRMGRQAELVNQQPACRTTSPQFKATCWVQNTIATTCMTVDILWWMPGCKGGHKKAPPDQESVHHQCDKKYSPLATNGSCNQHRTALTFVRSLSSTTAESVMFHIRRWSPQVASRSGLVAVLQHHSNTHCVSQTAVPDRNCRLPRSAPSSASAPGQDAACWLRVKGSHATGIGLVYTAAVLSSTYGILE